MHGILSHDINLTIVKICGSRERKDVMIMIGGPIKPFSCRALSIRDDN